jgi:cytochrome P450
MPTTEIDVYADDVLDDPYPAYAQLRSLGPVVFMEAHNAYVLPRYAACREALRNWQVFTSAQGVMMNDPLNQAFANNIMLCTNGDRHTRLRNTVAAPLTPRALAEVRGEIDAEAKALVGRLLEQERFDAVSELAYHLPVNIVSNLVGVPEEGRERMVAWAGATFTSIGPFNQRTAEAMGLLGEMGAFLETACVRENLRPGGWAAALYEAMDRGDLEAGEPAMLMNDYMGPALDTTINATSNMIWLFANHPDQWALLRKQPDLAANAINEVLRVETVIHGFSRVTTESYALDEYIVPSGSRVLISYGSANRDDTQFPDAARFDITRANAGEHLALGHGSHSCPGGHLARMEMRALLDALVPNVAAFELESCVRSLNNTTRGFASCVVTAHRS